MKVLVQNYGSGQLEMLDVPYPAGKDRAISVRTVASVVSVGTEKAMIDVAKKSLLGKALARPDWVRQVIDKVKTEGLAEAYRQSKARLDMPVPLGYSSAGIVVECGSGLSDGAFKVGDRVACTGSGYASHAERVVVPPNLCARIPDSVSFENAAYAALGGIAMEAVRLAQPEFGHNIVVIGLGLLGQLAVQILVAAGCHVLGTDISGAKCDLAREHGAEATAVTGKDDIRHTALDFTDGHGADSVIILAAVNSNEPLETAASICRERGKVVAGGLVGLDIPRNVFFEKELELRVSRAWGPGALNEDYENRNVQWPLAYARWTAQRNVEEFLRMLSLGRIRLDKLTTHRFPFEKAFQAYQLIVSGKENPIGVVLKYNGQVPEDKDETKSIVTLARRDRTTRRLTKNEIGVGLIGAGLFARGTLLPAMRKITGLRYVGVATATGLSGRHVADRFGFDYCTTDYEKILNDDDVGAVFVLTRHNSHARFVVEALKAGKAVFVEKPLAISEEQLYQICNVYEELSANGRTPYLMVGFNRRFSPAAVRAKRFLRGNGSSAVINIRCNAGPVPRESWVQHPEEGGGRIIGEVCHFVDLMQYLTGGVPRKVFASCAHSAQCTRDNLCVSLQMSNGAACSIAYAANGDKSFPRERVEIFAGGGVCVIDNFRNVEIVAAGRKRRLRKLGVDRGHVGELQAFFGALGKGMAAPVEFPEYGATTMTTFAIEESLTTGCAIDLS